MKAEPRRIGAFELGCWRRLLRVPWLHGDPISPSSRKSTLNIHWKDWCWSWSSNNLATWCKEPTHQKRLWCSEKWKAGGEGDDRGQDGWMASPTQWIWVWASSRRWWRTEKPGMLQSMGLQRVRHDWVTEHIISSTNSKHTVCLLWTWYYMFIFICSHSHSMRYLYFPILQMKTHRLWEVQVCLGTEQEWDGARTWTWVCIVNKTFLNHYTMSPQN